MCDQTGCKESPHYYAVLIPPREADRQKTFRLCPSCYRVALGLYAADVIDVAEYGPINPTPTKEQS